jgi:hypothetical protein
MSSIIRTRRVRRTRIATAAATVAIAALSLTACNDGTGVKDEGASAPAGSSSQAAGSASPVTDAKPTPDGSKADTAKANTAKPAASTPATSRTKAPKTSNAATSTKSVVCDGSNTRTVAAPVNRPVNHMLLTVTNTGSKTCDLYYYPAVKFEGAQSVPPVIEESQPQAVVSLAPGESGYAGVALSATDGSGSDGYTAKSLSVYFANAKGHSGYNGTAAQLSVPAKGVFVDSSIKVTYWQRSMDTALTW